MAKNGKCIPFTKTELAVLYGAMEDAFELSVHKANTPFLRKLMKKLK